MKHIVTFLLLCGLAVVILGGCAATQVTSDWKDPTYQAPPQDPGGRHNQKSGQPQDFRG